MCNYLWIFRNNIKLLNFKDLDAKMRVTKCCCLDLEIGGQLIGWQVFDIQLKCAYNNTLFYIGLLFCSMDY